MLGHHQGRHRGCGAFGEERKTAMSEGPFGRHFRRDRRMFEGADELLGSRHGFGRGERRRMFDGGELKLVILALIEVEPRHGYDLIREVEARSNGAYAPSPGIVYPTLALLEETGQIEARAAEGAKKQFALTEAGKAFLDQNRTPANAALARLDDIGARAAPMEAGPVARAMGNLRTALRQRLSQEIARQGSAQQAADRQVLFEVADILDDAARKIERL
jgi:DNA-binding PadR family transcriptional regulator